MLQASVLEFDVSNRIDFWTLFKASLVSFELVDALGLVLSVIRIQFVVCISGKLEEAAIVRRGVAASVSL